MPVDRGDDDLFHAGERAVGLLKQFGEVFGCGCVLSGHLLDVGARNEGFFQGAGDDYDGDVIHLLRFGEGVEEFESELAIQRVCRWTVESDGEDPSFGFHRYKLVCHRFSPLLDFYVLPDFDDDRCSGITGGAAGEEQVSAPFHCDFLNSFNDEADAGRSLRVTVDKG